MLSSHGTRRTVTNLRRSEEIRLRSEESIMMTRQQLRSRGPLRGRPRMNLFANDLKKRSTRLHSTRPVVTARRRDIHARVLADDAADARKVGMQEERDNKIDMSNYNSTPSPSLEDTKRSTVPVSTPNNIDSDTVTRHSELIRDHWSHLSLKRYKQHFNVPCRSAGKATLQEAVSRHFHRIDVSTRNARRTIASRFLKVELSVPHFSSQDPLESSSGPLEEEDDSLTSDFLEYD